LHNHKVVEIEGADRVDGIVIQDLKKGQKQELEVGGIFVEIGLIPNSSLVKDIAEQSNLKIGSTAIVRPCTGTFGGVASTPRSRSLLRQEKAPKRRCRPIATCKD
jgi:alkyl hydroperoxide reductase subunit AhpF